MARLLQSGWLLVLVGALVFFGTMFVLLDPSSLGTLPKTGPAPIPKRVTGTSWQFIDPEVDRLIVELNEEKLALNKQREHLTQWAKRLEAERAEISAITQAVHTVQAEFDRTFLRIQGEETKSLRRLAKTLAAMETKTAVAVMDSLGEEEMVKLLAVMKDDQLTAILEFIAAQGELEATRAANLASRLRNVIPPDAQP